MIGNIHALVLDNALELDNDLENIKVPFEDFTLVKKIDRVIKLKFIRNEEEELAYIRFDEVTYKILKENTMKTYSSYIMEKVRQNLGLSFNDKSMDKEIMEMPKEEIFKRCCEWEGIIGFSSSILGWVEDIFKVKLN